MTPWLERPYLALGAAVVAVVVLYILDRLRRRPVVLLVASLELFPKSVEAESQADESKKRAWRDLILRALAACLLALAAGGPRLAQGSSAGRRVRVLLDRSASMDAKDQGTTRLELARAELARALEKLASVDEVELHLDPPGEDEPRAPLSPDAARAFVPRVVCVPSTVAQRIDLVAAAAATKTVPLLVVTDHDVALVQSDSELAKWVEVAIVGTPQKNVGLTALASRRGPDKEEKLLVATTERTEVELILRTQSVIAVDRSAIASVPSGVERASATITTLDALASDDRATAVRRVDAPLRVVVQPGLGKPLEAALRAVPGSDVTVSDREEDADVTFREWKDRDVVTAKVSGFTVWFTRERVDAEPKKTLTLDDQPLGVGHFRRDIPSGVRLDTIVVKDGDDPVIGIGRREAWIGFWPPKEFKEGWANQVSFPRFFARLLEHVRSLEPEDLVCHPTGRPLLVPRPLDASPGARLVVLDPSGKAWPVEKSFTPTVPGVHEVRAESGKKTTAFAAALLDPDTSDLSKTRARPFSPALLSALSARPDLRTDAGLAWLLVLLALLLAGVAWSLDSR